MDYNNSYKEIPGRYTMGNLMTLTLYTDSIHEILEHCEEFCQEVYGSINNLEASTLMTGHGSVGKIQAIRHGSCPTIYVQMGNTIDEMSLYSKDTERLMAEHPESFQDMLKYMKQTVGELEKKFEGTRGQFESDCGD